MWDASNATLYCTVSLDGMTMGCVHKPIAGERPLWDFPDGTLAFREVAAFVVSEALDWAIVPPTVLREGPFGPGMCQLWIDVDEGVDLAALARSDHPQLRRMAVFDAVVNNADRKGGHLLPTVDGHVYGVDHGVCFSTEDKLRTLRSARAAGGRAGRIDARAARARGGRRDDRAARPAAEDAQAPAAQRRLAAGSLAAVLAKSRLLDLAHRVAGELADETYVARPFVR